MMFSRDSLLFSDLGAFLCVGPLKVDAVLRLIDDLAAFGYTSLRWELGPLIPVRHEPELNKGPFLYTEDELRAVDAYAAERGIEVIPMVQSLGHSPYICQNPAYRDIADTQQVLMVDAERTYEVLRHYYETFRAVFRSNTLHIGCDETADLGLGNRLKTYGYEEKASLYIRHLRRVISIAEEFGYHCEMWGDMLKHFVQLYKDGSPLCTFDCMKEFPKNVRVIEWFYDGLYSEEEMAAIFDQFRGVGELAYADSANCFAGFKSHNTLGLKAYPYHIPGAKAYGINTYLVTLWNDFRAGSPFSVLPALYTCSLLAHGKTLNEETKREFEAYTGVAFDDFMLLDLVDRDTHTHSMFSYFLLTDDLFAQGRRAYPTDGLSGQYRELSEKLRAVSAGRFSHLFTYAAALSDLLSVKAELGKTLKDAYTAHDRSSLSFVADQIPLCREKLAAFMEAFEAKHDVEYSPDFFGSQWERFGRLDQSLISTERRLRRLLAGEISTIPELE